MTFARQPAARAEAVRLSPRSLRSRILGSRLGLPTIEGVWS